MRSHGLTDFPDPTVGSNGLPSWTIHVGGNSDLNPQSPQYRMANKACKDYLPNIGRPTSAAQTAAALKYVTCMRSNGEPDFPDPNGQGILKITNTTGILDPNSPQYEKAQTACQSLDNGFSEEASSSSGAPGVGGP
jgi:hypothetical protein